MSFFKWLGTKINNALDDPRTGYVTNSLAVKEDASDSIIRDTDAFNFKIVNANGGSIIEVFHFDKRASEWEREYYVISEDSNFSTALTNILVEYKLKHL